MIKSFFLENLATKGMALFLSILTWAYLFIQGNGTEELKVDFRPPDFDREVFASVVYKDSDGKTLVPGDTLTVKISGPKGDVKTLTLRAIRPTCTPSIDPKDLRDSSGNKTTNLEGATFTGIPPSITLQPLSTSSVTLHYVKYERKLVKLAVPPNACEGRPAPGYEVESVRVSQEPLPVKIPADIAANTQDVLIGKVRVGGQDKSFVIERMDLGPEAQALNISALQAYIVSVNIAPVKKTKTLTVDVTVSSKPENLPRIKLATRSIKVDVRGPEELVDQIPEAALAAYVLVTDKDMEPPGTKNINESAIGCHVLDPKYQGKVSVTIMPDEKPENRQVKITVEEKRN